MSHDHKTQYLKMLADWLVHHFGIDTLEANKMIAHCRFGDLFDEDPEYVYHYNISYWGMLIFREWNAFCESCQ